MLTSWQADAPPWHLWSMETVPEILRGTRIMLGISQRQLAKEADVSIRSLSRLETGLHTSIELVRAVQGALEARGVRFLARDASSSLGIRMPPEWPGKG